MIHGALEAVAAAGVPFAFRGEQPLDGPPPGGDIDILVGAPDLARADRALRSAGFRRLRAAGHRGHRFYLGFSEGRWIKIDINVVPRRLGWNLAAPDPEHQAAFSGYRIAPPGHSSLFGRIGAAWARRRPLGLRRRGAVIALLGPDGAGKGSVAEALEKELPVAISRVYLGDGGSANSDGRTRRATRAGKVRAGTLREVQHLARKALRSCRRVLWPGYARAWRGEIVIFDRHPIEVLAVRPRRTRLGAATERWLARHLIPWPDAIVVLDAPGEVLYARKHEHSPETLEYWRRGYLHEFRPHGAAVVSTLGGLERAVGETSAVVWQTLSRRRGW